MLRGAKEQATMIPPAGAPAVQALAAETTLPAAPAGSPARGVERGSLPWTARLAGLSAALGVGLAALSGLFHVLNRSAAVPGHPYWLSNALAGIVAGLLGALV